MITDTSMTASTSWNNYLAMTWDKYLPPIRPYDSELNYFKRVVQEYISRKNSLPSVLILGSTPELRDVVYGFGIQPTVVDYDKDNYKAMSLLLKSQGNDTFFEMNWLDLNTLVVGQFDYIFSEAAFNVLGHADALKLYQICHSLLNRGGQLVAKQWIRFCNEKPCVEDLIDQYRHSDNSRGFYSHTCIPLMLCFYDYEQERITLKHLDDCVSHLLAEGKINKCEQSTIGIHEYQNVNLVLYIPRLIDFLLDVQNWFHLVSVKVVPTPFSEYHTIFVLEK